MSAHVEPAFDAGGDLGRRDTIVLEYQPHPEHAAAGTLESFYLAKGAGWFMWTRSDGVRIAFNRVGGLDQAAHAVVRPRFHGVEQTLNCSR